MDLFHQEVLHKMAASAKVNATLLGTLDERALNTLENWIASLVHERHLWPDQYLQHLMKVIGIIGTLFGLFLLLTNGTLSTLLISPVAAAWGIAVGFSFAFYILYPTALMKEWGVILVVGWSMLMGGIILGVVTRIWESSEWIYLMDLKLARKHFPGIKV